MAKYYAGTKITVSTSITNNGTLTDPTTVTFKWRINRDGEENTATVTNSSTGVYTTDITPEDPGVLYGKWETTGTPTVTKAVRIVIHDAQGIRG